MQEDWFSRSRMLLGEEAMKRLADARVAVFGIGGVGGYVVEALVRSGIGAIDLIDNDTVVLSNLNRQIIATMDTIGRDKVEVMAERARSINPSVNVTAHKCFYLPETADRFDFTQYDYVVDAIDTVTGKIGLVLQAQAAGVPVISAMGAGNKLDPSRFEVADIYETSIDPLARVMRRELKKRGVRSLKVVYSKEKPRTPEEPQMLLEESRTPEEPQMPEEELQTPEEEPKVSNEELRTPEEKPRTPEEEGLPTSKEENRATEQESTAAGNTHVRRSTPGSLAFVPSVAGLIIAGEVVKDLIGYDRRFPGA